MNKDEIERKIAKEQDEFYLFLWLFALGFGLVCAVPIALVIRYFS